MNNQTNLSTAAEEFGKAGEIFILISSRANADATSAALGLYQAMKKSGKTVTIASPESIELPAKLPGMDEITEKIGNRNLVISLQVDSRESIDKVSYNLDEEGKVFNLVVQPKKGQPPLKSNDVSYSYSGAQADMIFVFGAYRLEDMGRFYEDERKLFNDATTVSVNRAPQTFAKINLAGDNVSSVSEFTYELTKNLGLELTDEAATDLLAGIDSATNKLQHPTVTPQTFEAVANLLRAGGKRVLIAGMGFGDVPPFSPGMPPSGRTMLPGDDVPMMDEEKVPDEWLTRPKIYKGTNNGSSGK